MHMFLENETHGTFARERDEDMPLPPEWAIALRERIADIARMPLDERLSVTECARVLTPTVSEEAYWSEVFEVQEGREPNANDVEAYRKKFSERKRRALNPSIVDTFEPQFGDVIREGGVIVRPGSLSEHELIDLVHDTSPKISVAG